MRCPYCGSTRSQVKDSRTAEDQNAVRRRRVCSDCNARFTTFERVQLRELVVVKSDGRKVPFDREKLARSVRIALRKRPVTAEQIDAVVSGIVRELETEFEMDVPSQDVGRHVMAALKGLDGVAYVRFASVYKDFREAEDFVSALNELSADDDAPAIPKRSSG